MFQVSTAGCSAGFRRASSLIVMMTAAVCRASVPACQTAPLSDYLTDPAVSCSVGDVTFSNFTGFVSGVHYDGVTPGYPSEALPGDLANSASLITVVPTIDGNDVGLSFQASFYAQGFGAGQVLVIGYQASAPASDPLTGAGLSLSEAYSSSGGVTNGTLALCENGGYGPIAELPLPCDAGSVAYNANGNPEITSTNQNAVTEVNFGSTTTLGVFTAMQLFGDFFDYAGAAGLDTFVQTVDPADSVPEAGSGALVAVGLLLALVWTVRMRMRA